MRRISASAAAASGGLCLSDFSDTNPAGDLATSAPLPMTTQAVAEVVNPARVEDIVRTDPRAPRHLHAPAQAIERGDRVRVSGNDQRHAAVARQPRMRVAEIETLGLAIDLHGDAAFPRGGDDGGHVHLCRLTLEQTPAGR